MEYMKSFYLDKEKDIIVDLFREGEDPMDPVALDEEVDGYSVPLNVT